MAVAQREGAAAPEVGASAFLAAGFDLEELQYVIFPSLRAMNLIPCCHRRNWALERKKSGLTDHQATMVQERLLTFHRKLVYYRSLRAVHMPGLMVNEEQSPYSSTTPPDEISLHLPSSVAVVSRDRIALPQLFEAEAELRYAQAWDALDELRRHLRTRTCTNRFKIKNITGQRANTRARTMQKGIDDRVKLAAAKYRHAREAYLALKGPGEWESTLRILAAGDVRALNERAMTEHEKEEQRRLRLRVVADGEGEFQIEETAVGGPGEGHRMLSWIWLQVSSGLGDDLEMHHGECTFTVSRNIINTYPDF